MRELGSGTGELIEVGCDESGSEGENLIGANTDVFAHASVSLTVDAAAACIQRSRDRIRSPAVEYKAGHLLRVKHRSVLMWLLDPAGPIHGRAHVHLTNKTFFAVSKIIELLVEKVTYVASIGPGQKPQNHAMAVDLYRDGPAAFGLEQWTDFLRLFVEVLRTTNRRSPGGSVDSFFDTVDALYHTSAPGRIHEIIGLVYGARSYVDDFRAQLLDNSRMIPALDPLMPAIVQTVGYWSGGDKSVSIIHDEQPSLTKERIAQLRQILDTSQRGRLAGLRFVDSRSDPRVQVADFLAGVAQKIAADELNHRGDGALATLLRPYVDPFSVWGDERSWSLLRPPRAEER